MVHALGAGETERTAIDGDCRPRGGIKMGSYDKRAPSASSQIITLERLLEEAESRNEILAEELEHYKEAYEFQWKMCDRLLKAIEGLSGHE